MSNFDEVTVGNASEIGSGSHVVVLKGNLAKSAPPLNWKVTGGQVVCQESPNGPAPAMLFSNGSEGGLILGSFKDGVSIVADGPYSSMSMSKNGEKYFQFGSNGDLTLGGAGSDGDIYLSTGTGHVRIALGADEMRILIQNDQNEHLVTIGGNNGDIVAKGDITANGNIVAKGAAVVTGGINTGKISASDVTANSISAGKIDASGDLSTSGALRHQRITEHSAKITLTAANAQTRNLFPSDVPGAYVVELAASFIDQTPDPGPFGASSFMSWNVFVYGPGAPSQAFPSGSTGSGGRSQNSLNTPFWQTSPSISEANGFVHLNIPAVNVLGNVSKAEATLSARAFYGTILGF